MLTGEEIFVWETEKGLDFLASETLKARYLREGEKDWEEVCERVAKAVAATEEEYLDFKDLMAFGMFILALLTFVFTFSS